MKKNKWKVLIIIAFIAFVIIRLNLHTKVLKATRTTHAQTTTSGVWVEKKLKPKIEVGSQKNPIVLDEITYKERKMSLKNRDSVKWFKADFSRTGVTFDFSDRSEKSNKILVFRDIWDRDPIIIAPEDIISWERAGTSKISPKMKEVTETFGVKFSGSKGNGEIYFWAGWKSRKDIIDFKKSTY